MAIAVDGRTTIIIMEIRMEGEVTSIITTIEISIEIDLTTIIMEEIVLEILLRRLHHLVVLVGEIKPANNHLQEEVHGDLQNQVILGLHRGVLNLLDLGVAMVQIQQLKLHQNLLEVGETLNLFQHQKQELVDGEDQKLELHKKRKNKVHHLLGVVIQLIKIPIVTA